MDNTPQEGRRPSERPPVRPKLNPATLWLLVGLAILAGFLLFRANTAPRATIDYGMFRAELERDNIARVEVKGMKVYGLFKVPPQVPGGKTDEKG